MLDDCIEYLRGKSEVPTSIDIVVLRCLTANLNHIIYSHVYYLPFPILSSSIVAFATSAL